MPEFGPNLPESQDSLQTLAGIAIAYLILRILVAIAAAVWIFKDSEARGKSGIAAALIALLTVFYGIPSTLMVVCAWVLLRPGRIRRVDAHSEPLPDQLPPGIEATSSSEEFLGELEENG